MNDSLWPSGLINRGTHYEGFIEDVDSHLELHQSDCITTWAIRRSNDYGHSVLKDDKENSQVELIVPNCQTILLFYIIWIQFL